MIVSMADELFAKKLELWLGFSSAFYDAFRVEDRLGKHWFLIHLLISRWSKDGIPAGEVKALLKRKVGLDRPSVEIFMLMKHLAEDDRSLATVLGEQKKQVSFQKLKEEKKQTLPPESKVNLTENFKRAMRDYAFALTLRAVGPDQALATFSDLERCRRTIGVYYDTIMSDFRSVWVRLVERIVDVAVKNKLTLQREQDINAIQDSTEFYLLIHVIWKCSLVNDKGISEPELLEKVHRIRTAPKGDLENAIRLLARYKFLVRKTKNAPYKMGNKYESLMSGYRSDFLGAYTKVREALSSP